MPLRKSAEDYLEAIFIVQKQKGVAYSVDIAHHLGFSKPSVSRAVTNLRRDEYLIMKDGGELELTEKGLLVAQNIYERHTIITNLLTSLGVPHKTAAEDACRMEHVISDETFERFKAIYEHNSGILTP